MYKKALLFTNCHAHMETYMAVIFVHNFLLRNTTMRDKRNIVHFNLCLALLLASLTFVSGIETAKDNKVSYVLHKLYI